jgi:hypothetical protein
LKLILIAQIFQLQVMEIILEMQSIDLLKHKVYLMVLEVFFQVVGSATQTFSISGISVKERTGNRATQATAANRPWLRRGLTNLATQSDFANGLAGAPSRAGLVTVATMDGYSGALAFGYAAGTQSYAYKSVTPAAGAMYTSAFVVEMDDGLAPSFSGPASSVTNSLAIVHGGGVPLTSTYQVVDMGLGRFLVVASAALGANSQFGLIKYGTNDSRTFKYTRQGLFQGVYTAEKLLAAGGIPQTTTVPVSTPIGRWLWDFRGTNDSLVVNYNGMPSFTAGTLPSAADVFIGMTRRGAHAVIAMDATNWYRVFAFAAGGNEPAFWSAGSNITLRVNGALVGGVGTATRDQLAAALPTGTPCVLEATGCDLSTWVSLHLGGYGGWQLLGDVAALIVTPLPPLTQLFSQPSTSCWMRAEPVSSARITAVA